MIRRATLFLKEGNNEDENHETENSRISKDMLMRFDGVVAVWWALIKSSGVVGADEFLEIDVVVVVGAEVVIKGFS